MREALQAALSLFVNKETGGHTWPPIRVVGTGEDTPLG